MSSKTGEDGGGKRKTQNLNTAEQKNYSISFNVLLDQLKNDFPEFDFRHGSKFDFRPPKTIVIGPSEPKMEFLLLHELGHALLGHKDFSIDIERIKMESDAWEKARDLATKYRIDFDDDMMQYELDTYRDWLHKKSRCPICGLTRFQDASGYHCPSCESFRNNKK